MIEPSASTEEEFKEAVEKITEDELVHYLIEFTTDDNEVVDTDIIFEAITSARRKVAEKYPICVLQYCTQGRNLSGEVEIDFYDDIKFEYSVQNGTLPDHSHKTFEDVTTELLGKACTPEVIEVIEVLISGDWGGVQPVEETVEQEVDIGDETKTVQGSKTVYKRNAEYLTEHYGLSKETQEENLPDWMDVE